MPSVIDVKSLLQTRIDAIAVAITCIAMIVFYTYAIAGQSVNIASRWYPTLGDDTYISMRYAKHLASGQGLVWNLGEAPIEGYTNFLWVLWIAALTLLQSDPSYLLVWSAAAFHILSVVMLYLFSRRVFHSTLFVAVSSVLISAAWVPLRGWALIGSEIPMLFLLFVAAICFLFGDPPERPSRKRMLTGCFLAGLLPLVRPDGLFLMLVLMLGFAWQYIIPMGPLFGSLKKWSWAFVWFFTPVIALTVFRLAYFGDWLPNTYYLKVYGRASRFEQGLDYVGSFLSSFYGTPFLIALLGYTWWEKRRWVKAISLGSVLVFLAVIYEGGDPFGQWRFFAWLLPIFLMLLTALTERFRSVQPAYAVAIGMWLWILPVGAAPLMTASTLETIFPADMESTSDNIRMGLLLSRVCKPQAFTADFWAGAAPYFSGLNSIDMLGKSDRHIALLLPYKPGLPAGHDKLDLNYVLNRGPDVILSNHPLGTTREELATIKSGKFPFGAFLLEDQRFQSNYVAVESALSNRWHGIFRRRDSVACDWSQFIEEEYNLLAAPVNHYVHIDGTRLFLKKRIEDAVNYGTPAGRDGKAGILFWTGQAATLIFVEQEGDYLVRARLRHSDPPPVEMAIGVDGKQLKPVVLARGDNSWETVSLPVSLVAGYHSVDIWFLNNGIVNGKDRDGAVEWVTIERTGPVR